MKLDNLDRQIFGYIGEHSAALYGEIADALGCQKVIINSRIQRLYDQGYIIILESGKLELTEKAIVESSLIFDCTDKLDSSTEFIWDELYIPLNLHL